MTTTPTPAEFLAASDPDDEPDQGFDAPPEPLASIADSLRRLVAVVERHEAADAADGQAFDDYADLKREYDEVEALHDAKQTRLEAVLAVCKPSTSKLADKIRAVVEPPVSPPATREESAEPEGPGRHTRTSTNAGPDYCAECSEAALEWVPWPCPALPVEPPADDAPVEEWREYARSQGYESPNVDVANRSQIRTMLGISQPTKGEA